MKRYISILTFVFLFFILNTESRAEKILYYVDTVAIGQDSMVKALNNLSSTHQVVISANSVDFESSIKTDTFDLIILMLQDQIKTTTDFPEFTTYVQNGGKIIFSDAHMDSTFATLTSVTYIGNTNHSPINIIDKHLQVGLSTNSMILTNPGYTVWSMSISSTIRTLASFINMESAVVMSSDNILVNGFLVDTIQNVADGAIFFENEINYILSPPSIAVPLSNMAKVILLLLFAMAGAFFIMTKEQIKGAL